MPLRDILEVAFFLRYPAACCGEVHQKSLLNFGSIFILLPIYSFGDPKQINEWTVKEPVVTFYDSSDNRRKALFS